MKIEWNRRLIDAFKIMSLFGLVVSLYVAMNVPLNSDSVEAGIAGLSLRNGQYIDTISYVTYDPFTLTEIVPVSIILYFTGPSVLVLRLVAWLVFVAMAIGFALLVRWASGDDDRAWMCFALFTCLGIPFLVNTTYPICHNVTYLLLPLMMWLFYREENRLRLHGWLLLATIVLAGALVYSDSMITLLFAVPLYFYSLYRFFQEKNMRRVVDLLVACAFMGWSCASIALQIFVFHAVPVDLIQKVSIDPVQWATMYVRDLTAMFNYPSAGVYALLGFIMVLGFAGGYIQTYIRGLKKGERSQYALVLLTVATIALSGLYLMTVNQDRVAPARYIVIAPMLIVTTIALGADTTRQRALALLMCGILVFGSIAAYDGYQWGNPREEQVTDYLQERGYTYGFSNYWGANLLTYIGQSQGHNLTVMSLGVQNSTIAVPNEWMSQRLWYHNATHTFIAIPPGGTVYNKTVQDYNKYNPPTGEAIVADYHLYFYDQVDMQEASHGTY